MQLSAQAPFPWPTRVPSTGHHQDQQRASKCISNTEKAVKGSHIPWWPPKVKATQPAVMAQSQYGKVQTASARPGPCPSPHPQLGFLTPFCSTAGFTGPPGFTSSGRTDSSPHTRLHEETQHMNTLDTLLTPEPKIAVMLLKAGNWSLHSSRAFAVPTEPQVLCARGHLPLPGTFSSRRPTFHARP